MNVRHATLLDVFGRPAKSGGFAIMPAALELDGTSFSLTFPLADLPPDQIPPVLRLPIQEHYDASWVRARLPIAFGIVPEPSEGEKSFLSIGFVAVAEGANEAVAFECADHYGKTSLIFSEHEVDDSAKQAIALAFWNVLLSEPDDLEDFEATVLHLGAPVTLHFGCENGEPFCHEIPDSRNG